MPKGTPTIQPAKMVEYETPKELFDELWEEFGGLDTDPCCQSGHYTARRVLAAGGEIMVPPPPRADGGPTVSGWAGAQNTYYDGLKMTWKGKVYMNPPYGPALKLWVPKAVHEVECGNAEMVVALLPAKTEVKWFQEYVVTAAEKEYVSRWGDSVQELIADGHPLVADLRFLKRRLHFGGGEGPARCGNVIVVWRK